MGYNGKPPEGHNAMGFVPPKPPAIRAPVAGLSDREIYDRIMAHSKIATQDGHYWASFGIPCDELERIVAWIGARLICIRLDAKHTFVKGPRDGIEALRGWLKIKNAEAPLAPADSAASQYASVDRAFELE